MGMPVTALQASWRLSNLCFFAGRNRDSNPTGLVLRSCEGRLSAIDVPQVPGVIGLGPERTLPGLPGS